ncbi:hypothetical protein ACOZ4F_07075 [Haloarcula marismortui]|uniref:hypothetical protein n=1 Tax=Haloarcula marismortui TaxID=2238 RepID=UPI003C721E78
MIGLQQTGLHGLLAQGIATLLVAFALSFIKDSIFDSGDSYASVFGRFASKRETALLLICFAIGGTYVSGAVQSWIATILTQPGNLTIAAGLGIWAILVMTNRQVENWKLFSDSDPLLQALAIVGTGLVIIPLL